MAKEYKIKVKEIGLDIPRSSIVLKGTKKSVLAEKEVYSIISLQEENMEQLSSLMTNSPSENNQFIKDILNLTGEEIKRLDIDMEPTGTGLLTSTLEFSYEKLKPVLPSDGINYALIYGGDIFLNNKVVINTRQLGRKEGKHFEAVMDSIDFRDVESFYDNVKGVGSIDFDKKGYDKLKVSGQGIGIELSVNPFLPIPMPSGVKQFLLCKFDENTYYGFALPKDVALIDSIFQKTLEQVPPEQRTKYKVPEEIKDKRLRTLSIMKRILEKNKYKVASVYVDGRPIQPLNETTILYKPEYTIINLEKDSKTESLKCSGYFGTGLSALSSNNLFLKKRDSGVSGLPEDRSDYLNIYA